MDDRYEPVTLSSGREADLLSRVAAEHGLRVEKPSLRELDPALVLYLVGAAHLVRVAIEDFYDRKAGGQIIDLRPGQELARRDPGLEWGRVLVIAADGSFEVREQRRDRFADTVAIVRNAVSELPGSSIREARSAVSEALPGSTDEPPAAPPGVL